MYINNSIRNKYILVYFYTLYKKVKIIFSKSVTLFNYIIITLTCWKSLKSNRNNLVNALQRILLHFSSEYKPIHND